MYCMIMKFNIDPYSLLPLHFSYDLERFTPTTVPCSMILVLYMIMWLRHMAWYEIQP